jgi:endonuclease/exonuclease/phosphatase family metal-dependent hydrolase
VAEARCAWRSVLSRVLCALLGACTLLCSASPALARDTLRLATWNLEWLMTTETFDRLARTCSRAHTGDGAREIPCDIVAPPDRSLRRTAADFERLRMYAQRLNADVIALQEVDGPGAAALVFPGYNFCFTRRTHVQNVGFALRAGIAFRCTDYPALALASDGLRWGAQLTLFADSRWHMQLLAVHLKSGCPSQVLSNRREECRRLARQVPVLERWIDERAAADVPFAVLGDFNRRLARERHVARDRHGKLIAMWPELDDGDPPEAELTNVTAGQPYRRCSPHERYDDFIDHILLSRSLAPRLVPGSFEQITFDRTDMRGGRLSDHCPFAVTVKVGDW